MKACELRIGNYYSIAEPDGIKYKQVTYLIPSAGEWFSDGDNLTQAAKSIPLTEEWLLKAGFAYHKSEECVYFSKTYGKNGLIIITKDYHQKGFEFELGKGLFKSIEFVHNLQNGFYFLTDTELIIKS